MILARLIADLQEIERERGGDLEVFTIHGPSGVSNELGTVHLCTDASEKGCDGGPLCKYPDGKPFVWIYEGT